MNSSNTPIDIYIGHAFETRKGTFFQNSDSTFNTADMTYVEVSYFEQGGEIGGMRSYCRPGNKFKCAKQLYENLVTFFQFRNKNAQLHFHLPEDIGVANLKRVARKGTKFTYVSEDSFCPRLQYAHHRSETLAYCHSIEHAQWLHDVFDNQTLKKRHYKKEIYPEYHVATDGSCSNDRRGAFACVSEDGYVMRKRIDGVTSTEAEAYGVTAAIEQYAQPDRHLVIYTDSQGVLEFVSTTHSVDAFDDGIMADCFRALHEALDSGCAVTLRKVKAHSGDTMNETADVFARRMRQAKKKWGGDAANILLSMMDELHGPGDRKVVFDGRENAYVRESGVPVVEGERFG